MRPFAAIDELVLGRIYAPISRVCGRRYGSTACSLSRACIAPMLVFHAIRSVTLWMAEPHHNTIEAAIIFGITLLWCAALWIQAPAADNTPNPFASEKLLRLAILLPGLVLMPGACGWGALHDVAMVADNIAAISIFYFRGCPAPPPKRLRKSMPLSSPLTVSQ